MRTLVAYFSATGTTAGKAKKLAKVIGCDIFEIVPETPYTTADLKWRDKESRTSIECNDPACRPAIATRVENMDDYDTIFLGFPIWWYCEPPIINTFLEQYDLAGKTIIPFATSAGSSFGKTIDYLKPSAPGAIFLEGKMVRFSTESSLRSWVESLNLNS
ncbi:MAG: NAD(P)H-dependent oxidoreductase [Coriobacteriales bacterium]|nr:NAD(P)H-dependent oxidoreductase [Coriobacteriales bacterium]